MECVEKLERYPNDLFSNSFKETIDETKKRFNERREFISKPMIKCCVLGNTSTGKSALINALLKKKILYEGIPEGTSCAAKCQLSSNNEEYFEIYTGNVCLDEKMKIDFIQNINKTNQDYSRYSMDTNNYLDIYLKVLNHEILQNFLIIDCPGFDDNNLDAISKYCNNADIIVFCFRARGGITDDDIVKIEEIKRKIGKFQKCFIINCCDECDSIDREGIINKLIPHLKENEVFFISAREEKEQKWNEERHREFERFKTYLQNQKFQATFAYRTVYLDLIVSINKLLDFMSFTNFREYRFSDAAFTELQQQVQRVINDDKTKYSRDESDDAFTNYADIANKEISDFVMKQFVNDYNLNEGIINENYFYQLLIDKDANEPTFSWYEFGDKSRKIKRCFLQHFNIRLRKIRLDLESFYSERTRICLNELKTYKDELNIVIYNINQLRFQV